VPRPRNPRPSTRRFSGRKAFAVAVAVIVVLASVLLGPWLVFGRSPTVMMAGGAVVVAVLVVFLVVVRAKTDRWKE
jgi:membrane protein YdbS with pleckstrin-like domain